MNKEQIKDILIERGYSERGAETASSDLLKIDDKLKSCRDKWLTNEEESDYEAEGFSIKGIMHTFHMRYPAALLSLNWIIVDPKTAIPVIKKGIR